MPTETEGDLVMPIAAAPAPVLRPPPTPLPYRVPIREIAVLVDGEVLMPDQWTARRPTGTR